MAALLVFAAAPARAEDDGLPPPARDKAPRAETASFREIQLSTHLGGKPTGALAIRSDISALNAERARSGELVVQFGVGMHAGDVVLGAIGLPERSDYTAIGDTVNTASRMETLTKEYKVDAVLSSATAGHLRDDGVALQSLGEAQVRGKSNAVEVFTLS